MIKRTISVDDDVYDLLNLVVTAGIIMLFIFLVGVGLHRAGIV